MVERISANPRKDIGRAIAARRTYLGMLTQTKLAQRVSEAYAEYYGGQYPVCRHFISKVERGIASLPAELLLPMAIALQVSNPFDLLTTEHRSDKARGTGKLTRNELISRRG